MSDQAAASEDLDPTYHPSQKSYANARAEYALRGHALIACGRGTCGKDSWVVSRWGQARSFDSWPSVLEFLAQIGGPR